MDYLNIKMLLSLLSIVGFTLAYPGTEISKFITFPSSRPSTSTKPRDVIERLKDKTDRENCKCVPYYLCDYTDIVQEVEFQYPLDGLCQDVSFSCCKNPKSEESATTVPRSKKGCGYRNPQGAGTFTSSNLRNLRETPWVVALMTGNTTVGAGALVHPQVVLTAAHVPAKYPNDALLVRAGEWLSQTENKRLKPEERTVENIKIHKDFISTNLFNDIALLRLQAPMELAEHINVICLPDQDEDFDHSRGCIASGWMKDKSGSLTLKKVEADILQSESCNAKLKSTRLGKRFLLNKSFLCAEEKSGFTCQGDGGAPLACPGVEAYKVCGLVAWGIGCGDENPAVYARVSMFREWIDDTMREWGYGADEWL